jgi:uncharacterized protein (TIGR02246 family)
VADLITDIINNSKKKKMKTLKITVIALFMAATNLVCAQGHEAKSEKDKSAIEKLILSLPESLKAADISKVLPLFTADAVVMPNNAPTVKGSEQIKGLFENVFKKMTIDITYVIDEVVINGEYAYVRTHSKGNNVVLANGENVLVNNKELFVVHRDKGEWKITHYMGNHN